MQQHANGEITVDIRNRVAHLTLNRPQALNALSYEMVLSMATLFTQWSTDDAINAVVMRGAGEKSFCAGGDIRALRDSARNNGTLHHDFFIDEYRLDYQLHRYVKPVICLLDGIVMGGGMGISQGSGFRVVGPKTKMAMPETGIGLFPDVGGSYFLSRSKVGQYLGLTGQMIKASDALYANLADRFMTTEAIATLVAQLDAHKWSTRPANDIAALIDAYASEPAEPSTLAPLQSAIDQHFAPQKSVAEMIASLESESLPTFQPWAGKTAALLKTRSPTLLEVTRRQLNRGSKMTLAECFRMELGIVYHCFEHGDLMEGIRAVILDKDNQPRWNPATLADLEPETVAAFFAPRWKADNHPLANLEQLFG
ncbi:MAG: enoyl-CoA hydratase/isomerase family protein [Burkholderiales bacterium]|nr:enoyl-CoA hydratase/isomerase family protein [Burkholderiales bacterium]